MAERDTGIHIHMVVIGNIANPQHRDLVEELMHQANAVVGAYCRLHEVPVPRCMGHERRADVEMRPFMGDEPFQPAGQERAIEAEWRVTLPDPAQQGGG